MYQVYWSKEFQNNFYENLVDNQTSKLAEKIKKEEKQNNEREKQYINNIDSSHRREKYQRRWILKNMQNSRVKNLAEIKTFKGNYKRLMEKLGVATTVAKNRDKIKHSVVGGLIDINNKQNKKIFEMILDEAKVLKEKIK